MIVFQNSLLILDYLPDYDILSVDWPDIDDYELSELQDSLDKLIEVLKSYDVKNLLFDVSNSKVNIRFDEYRDLI